MNSSVTIIITGRPYSKKNSRASRIRRSKRTGKMYGFSVPGENYENFRADALMQLLKYRRHKFPGKVRIDYLFYRKGQETQDFDNAIASVNDVLQESGIIVNDKLITKGSFEIIQGGKEWSTQLQVGEIEA